MKKWILTGAAVGLLISCTSHPPSSPVEHPDSFELSVEGIHRLNIHYRQSRPRLEEIAELKKIHSDFLEDDLEVAVNWHAPEAPTAIFVAGLFGGYDSPEMLWLGRSLYERGFNVFRFPNTDSKYVVKLHPRYRNMDFEAEAQLYADAITKLREQYHFSRLHLIGSSYGGFLAAVTAAKLGPQAFDGGKLVLLSPPADLSNTLRIMDGYFDDISNELESTPWSHVRYYVGAKWASLWGDDIYVPPTLAKSLAINGVFHKMSVKLIEMDREFKEGRGVTVSPYWKQARDMRYVSFLKSANPSFFKEPEKLSLLHWLKMSPVPWRIFSTADDYVNTRGAWPMRPEIVVYPDGGHIFGYMERPEFLRQFQVLFPD